MIKLPDTEGLQERVPVAEQMGPGPRLRAAREASGYEIEEIAKQLRLHPHIIEDLERDTFSDHLALVFVRGYLRSYAGLIGLDPEQVVREFNALGYEEDRDLPDFKGKAQSKNRMRNRDDINKTPMNPGMKWGAIIALVAALGGIFIAYSREPEVQLNSVPLPISNSTEPDASLNAESVNSVDPSATTTAPAARPSTNAAPATAPGAAAVSNDPNASAQTPAAVPAPAPKPAPRDYDEDDYYDPDAMNEPILPKPGRNT